MNFKDKIKVFLHKMVCVQYKQVPPKACTWAEGKLHEIGDDYIIIFSCGNDLIIPFHNIASIKKNE